jgi:hypothetical protein
MFYLETGVQRVIPDVMTSPTIRLAFSCSALNSLLKGVSSFSHELIVGHGFQTLVERLLFSLATIGPREDVQAPTLRRDKVVIGSSIIIGSDGRACSQMRMVGISVCVSSLVTYIQPIRRSIPSTVLPKVILATSCLSCDAISGHVPYHYYGHDDQDDESSLSSHSPRCEWRSAALPRYGWPRVVAWDHRRSIGT